MVKTGWRGEVGGEEAGMVHRRTLWPTDCHPLCLVTDEASASPLALATSLPSSPLNPSPLSQRVRCASDPCAANNLANESLVYLAASSVIQLAHHPLHGYR